ncbi:alanyl-tRNA editing protein [Paratissierella segnis]|uniref:Metal-dependent hydrolase n=1 Tax=Paratissierella segnis TaxID=2763679 RepID=A0A926IFE5_9FIRM|nr:DHHA1 domain-containing protein [Paratissierella segnis]MBC8588402.1 metal-dependent hydrolase [Paratissierella segnis]
MTKKVYMDNPYLKELDAFIIDKKKKDNTYHIKLDKTIFYPHLSGGQPGDQGTINGIEVLESYEENDDIIHVLKQDIKENKVQISIDFDNRLDMMQQHTGQHLLSSCFYRLFDAQTVGFHVGHDYVTIDVTMSELTEEDAEKIEIMANKIIWSNFNIKSYFPSQERLKKLPLRKMPTVTKNIRIVEIDGFDYSPCGGTHLKSTGELGMIKIRKWEKYKGNIRVEFLCGNRALKDYTWKNKYIKTLSLMLSSLDKDLLTKVKKLYDDKNALEKETRELREDLNKIKGDEFLKSAKQNEKVNFIVKILENTSLLEVSFISSYLNNNNKNLVQIYGLKSQDKGQFYITKTKDVNINLLDTYKDVSSKVNIKGGGNPNSIQGAIEVDDIENATNLFYKEFVNELAV